MKLSTWGRPASKPGFGWQAYVFQNRVNQPGSWNFRFDFRRPVLYRRYPLHTTNPCTFRCRVLPRPARSGSLINEWTHARVTWVSLREHGCTYQCATRRLAVRMPMCMPSLESGERDRLWEFEEGHCGHPLRNIPANKSNAFHEKAGECQGVLSFFLSSSLLSLFPNDSH